MSSLVYTRYELLRTFRNRRFFIFALIFPLILFYLVAGSNRHAHLDGISFPLYYMAGMMAFGSMSAVLAGGARIALERTAGWTRQVRISPLSMVAYLRAKLLSAYLMALLSVLLLSLAATTLGVHLNVGDWLLMVGLILLGLIPYAVMGIALGNLLTTDSMAPAQGGITALFSILGGSFGPIAKHGALHQISSLLPSYWITQASRTVLDGHVWAGKGFLVIAVWTAAMIRLAMVAYARSGARV
jgi:ABC-2 type transport system permease protein